MGVWRARGSGTFYERSCVPSCAAGTTTVYQHVSVTLSETKLCKSTLVAQFRRMVLTFTSGYPADYGRRAVVKLSCGDPTAIVSYHNRGGVVSAD